MKINTSLERPAFLIALLLIAGCGNNKTEDAARQLPPATESDGTVLLTASQIETAGIRTGRISERQISGAVRVNGVLDVPPQQLVSISVPVGGFVKNTTLLEGSRVRKGERIATIENIEFIQLQQDYMEAKAQVELTKADYERQQTLAKENVNSQKTLQQAKATWSSWQSRYTALREKLAMLNMNIEAVEAGDFQGYIHLYSPINGYVTGVNVNIGKFVNPADVLFEIADTEHLHAELVVFEKDVPKLKIGQTVRFTLANESTERLARIYLIGREISDDRTVQVHCHINKEDRELLPGMYLTGVVETGGQLVPTVPDAAIVDYRGDHYVFAAGDNSADSTHQSFTMIPLKTGNSASGYTEVIGADSLAGADIVVSGAYAILSAIKNREEEGEQ